VRRTLLVCAVALAAAPAASAARPWTLAEAKQALRADIVSAQDLAQADRPVFQLSFAGLPLRGLGRTGPRRFRYTGPARDVLGGGTIGVAFTVAPDGAGGVELSGFRGPPADLTQPSLPLRAAFFYGWFSEGWSQQGFLPFTRYRPGGGFYDSGNADVIRRQIDAMRYGKIAAAVYSWWGPSSNTDLRFPLYLAAARQTPFRWGLYLEDEGYRDVPVEEARGDLELIRDSYAAAPAYLRIGGRFVVFVYGGVESCSVADRWREANTVGAYVVLPAFAGYRDCASQPDEWHLYSATLPEFELHGYSYGICPGFWRIDEQPREPRDLEAWKRSIRDMVASAEPLQLVVTFNEWGEGTSVEAADEWQTPSGYGAYLDALHADGG
jgi:hypothetical protein